MVARGRPGLSSAQAIANVESKTVKPRKRRRQRSIAERRRLVEQTLAPGVSVKDVAAANDARANQLFKWRRQYYDGRLGPASAEAALLPVRVLAPKVKTMRESSPEKAAIAAPNPGLGSIRVEFPHCRVLIGGAVDTTTLRTLMESLTR